jgi:uncharacterized protein YcbK (DUF882 family)
MSEHPESFNGRWKNFSDEELKCQHTGLLNPNPEFIELMDNIQKLRNKCGPLTISSAYRHPTHPIEAAKDSPGMHSLAAVDIKCSGLSAMTVLEAAVRLEFSGIGIQQKGDYNSRFIHLDLRASPTLWSY